MIKSLIINFTILCICLSFSQAINSKRNLVLRFTGPAKQNSHTMTRYYTEPKQLIDLWKNKYPKAVRKHDFKRWEYEAPQFKKAHLRCNGEIPKKWEIHGGAPRWGHAQWKFACGYRNPPEYVQRYYEYAKPWSRRRAEKPKRFKRLPQQIFVHERYNY